PLYYIAFAVPMVVLGVSTKWSIALVTMACVGLSGAIVLRGLRGTYGFFAAAIAACCYLYSPARTPPLWFDGFSHRVVIDLICLVYVLYLWRSAADAKAWRIGLNLGLASAACAYLHLQFGAIACCLLFALTAVTMLLLGTIALQRAAIALLL